MVSFHLFSQVINDHFIAPKPQYYPDLEIPIFTQGSKDGTLSYFVLLVFLNKVLPYVTSLKLTISLLTLLLQTFSNFLFILDVNPLGLLAFFNNQAPLWDRPYKVSLSSLDFLVSSLSTEDPSDLIISSL